MAMAKSTVLVVEDQERLADLYETWLAAEYDVRTAHTAAEAETLLDHDIDVALLDRRLPDGSGDDVLKIIRESGLDARVAMVTAVDPDFDILEMGFDDYVVKPVTESDLYDIVEGLLDRDRYSGEVQQYYALASKRATLESEKSADELDASPEYDELLEELTDLREGLHEQAADLDETDYEALFREL
jgi:DNA-binding response OmpR family regulator